MDHPRSPWTCINAPDHLTDLNIWWEESTRGKCEMCETLDRPVALCFNREEGTLAMVCLTCWSSISVGPEVSKAQKMPHNRS
jgi:hypothetical protein